MVFTAAQTTSFLCNADQMDLAKRNRAAIADEGLTDLADLVEFDKASLKQISENLRRTGGCVTDPDQPISVYATILTPAFVFGAKSQFRL